jgi:hypothetical protein
MIMNTFIPLEGTPSMNPELQNNPWIFPGVKDTRVERLKEKLLELPKFKMWCRLAERVNNLKERNIVMAEILKVAAERAELLART